MTFVIMGDAFDVTKAHGQDGLGSLKRLNLGLLIDREHHGVVWGIEVETHNVADLLDEERVVGNLEMPLAMRLDAEQIEPPVDGALGDTRVFRHRTNAPVRSIRRFGSQGRVDDFGNTFILMRAGASRTQFIVESGDTLFAIALSPLADGCIGDTQTPGYGRAWHALGAGQHHLGSQHQTMRQGSGAGEALQFRFLTRAEHDGSNGATAWHGHTSRHQRLPTNISSIYGTLH